MFFKIFGKSTALLFEMNKENMAEQQENKDWLDKLGEFFSRFSLIQIKILPIPFASVVKMKLKFGIPFLMGTLVGLFVLFYLPDF